MRGSEWTQAMGYTAGWISLVTIVGISALTAGGIVVGALVARAVLHTTTRLPPGDEIHVSAGQDIQIRPECGEPHAVKVTRDGIEARRLYSASFSKLRSVAVITFLEPGHYEVAVFCMGREDPEPYAFFVH